MLEERRVRIGIQTAVTGVLCSFYFILYQPPTTHPTASVSRIFIIRLSNKSKHEPQLIIHEMSLGIKYMTIDSGSISSSLHKFN